MKKLQTICATLMLVCLLGATVHAEDGIMGTGGHSAPVTVDATKEDANTELMELLLATELTTWQYVIPLF
ncbi:MAG: hypothetical protein ACJ74W_08950 [Pyrinomonadaceae bacterium]